MRIASLTAWVLADSQSSTSSTQHLKFFGALVEKELKVSGGEMRCFAKLFGKVHFDAPYPLFPDMSSDK